MLAKTEEKVSQIQRTYYTDWHVQLTHGARRKSREEEEEIEHHIAIFTVQIVRFEGFEHECWNVLWLTRDTSE